jgi:hypothetical protein
VPGFTVFQILDTDQLFAMQAAKGCDAGVERFVAESVFRGPGSYHGAGTAVAGSAALLGATQTAVLAQILEDCGVGGDIFKGNFSLSMQESNQAADLPESMP